MREDGTLDLNGNSDLIGSLTMIGGVVTNSGSGFLQLSGNVNATSVSNAPARIRGQLNLGSSNRTFTITNGPSARDLEIDDRVLGTGGVIKSGPGLMSLLASNSYSGVTILNDGILEAGDDFALGSTSATTQINPGATLSLLTAANNVGDLLTLAGDGFGGTNGALRSVGAVTCDGPFVLTGDTLINVVSGALNMSGVISGGFGLAKIGAGTLQFTGPDDNTYTGDTEVRSGILELGKTSAFAISNSASLLIGDSSDNENADTVRYAGGNQLRTSVGITINRTGVLDLNGFVDDVGSLQMTGGTIQTGTGQLQLRGNVTAVADTAPGNPLPTVDSCRITGNLDLGANTRTFTVNNDFFLSGLPVDLIVDANITGTSGGISKTGLGEMQLNGSNSFGGSVVIVAGKLLAANDHALGNPSGGTDVANAATLELLGNICITNEVLSLNSSSTAGSLRSSSGTNVWDGLVNLGVDSVVNVSANSRLDLAHIISGSGALTKIGAGTLGFESKFLVLDRDNTFTGTTFALEGVLLLGRTHNLGEVGIFYDLVIPGPLLIGDDATAPGTVTARVTGAEAIHTNSPVTVNASGLFDLSFYPVSIGSLEGAGPVTLGNSALNGAFTVGNNNLSKTYAGVLSGSRTNVTKTGTGTLILSANNTYNAPTFVQAGVLEVNGSQGNSDITVRANATLAGRGSVGDLNVGLNGNVTPGSSPGKLTAQNTVLSNDAVLNIEIRGPVVGTDYDQFNVNGTVNLTGSKLFLSGDLTNAPPFEGDVFTILNNNGTDAVVGTFDGRANGSVTTLAGIPLRLDYNGGTGNDVTLTVAGLPLAGASATLALGNGDGRLDPNECNNLFLRVTNRSAGTLTFVQATLTTATPGVIITDPFSPYPNLGPGTSSTNLVPFQFFTTPAFQCGGSIEFILTITTSNQSPFNLRFLLQSGALNPPQTFANNTPLALPGSGTVSSPLSVSGVSGGIAKATVSLVLQHPHLGELILQLVAPDGTGVTLTGPLSGTQLGTNCASARLTFDDDAALPISNGSSPFVGSFRPTSLLATLDGRSGAQVNGVWQLRVFDLVGNAQPGVLSCWSLILTPATCTDGGGPCTPCNGPFFGAITTNEPIQSVVIGGPGPTTCAFDPCGFITLSTGVPTDRYTFTNGTSPACVTVTIDAPCANPTNALVSSAVLLPPFNTNLCSSPVGLSGRITNSPASYSFPVPANAAFAVQISGGSSGFGFCSSYSLRVDGFDCAVPLTLQKLSPGVVGLCWPTHGSDLRLECSTTIEPAVWTPVTNPPVVINGSLCVTNVTTNSSQFYRLRKP